MARWQNEELWNAKGEDIGRTGAPTLTPAQMHAVPHQCRGAGPCGYFRCPQCRRVVPWCFGAGDGPECDECWGLNNGAYEIPPSLADAQSMLGYYVATLALVIGLIIWTASHAVMTQGVQSDGQGNADRAGEASPHLRSTRADRSGEEGTR